MAVSPAAASGGRWWSWQRTAVEEWLSEIGGGLDYRRTMFLNLMGRMEQREVAHRLVAHRDCLSRFGFDWFESFARQYGCTFTIVNQASLSPQGEIS